ncbi:hypothetical protein PybrP1_011400 [[Pythium] brassicae (nom. inval.)]|nr:hypothetical protein PybrP1_011400 [[Pythium] brassicae (nom. inval.)]
MARVGGAADTWHEEDDVELKQSLQQKEAITGQMISIISTRLNSLQTVANSRKFGLECDLRVNSDFCSKMVPGLQDPYGTRVGTSGKTKAVSSTTVASNQAMMERLFGPDEKSRLRTQILKKNKIELQKNENRRNARIQLEKQLQASIEGHVTRTVESYAYTVGESDGGGGGSNAVYVNSKLLLLHTFERIRITNGKKGFKRFLLSEVSSTLFEEMFWLSFCHFYQKKSMPQQRALVDELSAKYVKMLATLRGNIDYIFRIYPYAIASGVCWGFHYLFPGSRHLYTSEFKNDIYLFVCELLLGLKLCPVTVQSMRRQYFPDEVLDDLSGKSKSLKPPQSAPGGGEGSGGSPSTIATDLAFLPRIQSAGMFGDEAATAAARATKMKKNASESYLGKQALKDNSIDRILETAAPDDSTGRRMHQARSMFNTSQLSPLMKEYFGSQTKAVKKPCYLLRTTPVEGRNVGGEDTYRKYYRRKNQKNFAAEALREQEKCYQDIHKVQSDTRREINVLQETRDVVLNSGRKALQAYCTLLLTKKRQAAEDEELKRVAPRLRAYEPRDASWQQAEKLALEARDVLNALLRSPEGIEQLRSSAALDDMRALVPEVTRGDISELPVADFVLGMLFVQPYMAFEDVYRGYGPEYGKELSAEARKSENLIKSSYIYGEILFFPFADAIRWVAPTLPEHAVFYDLGSGTGKAVIAASLLHPFDQAIGIELLEPLVACADKRKDALARCGNPFQTDIEFLHASLLTTSWDKGDVVFCHGTCFSDKEWAEISLAAEKLRQGAYFLSTSHVLQSALFEVVRSYNFKMSWGTATLFVHRRRKIGRWAAQMLRGGRATRTDLLEQQQQKLHKSAAAGALPKNDELRE